MIHYLIYERLSRNHGLQTIRQLMCVAFGLGLLAAALAGCDQSAAAVSGGVVQVVAGENFWGSIATQLGGKHASVTSVVTDPNADPHEYESNTSDARAYAQANYVILN